MLAKGQGPVYVAGRIRPHGETNGKSGSLNKALDSFALGGWSSRQQGPVPGRQHGKVNPLLHACTLLRLDPFDR